MAELKGANRYDPEVLKLLKLMGTDDLMLQMLDMVLKAQIPQMEAEFANSEISDFPLEDYVERIQQRVDIDSLIYQIVPSYSRYYTREEISGLIAFYETPLGSKFIKVLPQILQESMATFMTFGEAAIEKATNGME
jgi:hypothetical protein